MPVKIEYKTKQKESGIYFKDLEDGDAFIYLGEVDDNEPMVYIKDKVNNEAFCVNLSYSSPAQSLPVKKVKVTLIVEDLD